MNILESTITIGSWELPWTLETALFWLLFAIVCITLFMVIVFGILLRRIGKNKTVTAVVQTAEEPEKVEYGIVLHGPENLPAMQVALYNGSNQIGLAVPVQDGAATILAVPGDYTIKVFGLPENYDFTAGVVSAENHVADVQVEPKPDVSVSPYEIRYVPESQPEPEKVEYTVNVEAPDNLPVLQVALFNGENQIGSAIALTDGCAKISAEPGDYTIKIFGLPEGFIVESGVLSATSLEASVKITEIAHEEPEDEIVATTSDVIETAPEEEVEYNVVVTAPDGLPAMQIALYNGETQIGNAVNVESGAATISALPGEYTVKLFGVPDGYDITAGTLSESRHICNITVTPVTPSEVAAAGPAVNTGVQIDEESFEGGVLRYDKSFTARMIQSENEIKGWYTDIKNELLSYKRVHARMSWKRESYNFGRESFAKISFRGNTLCLYLPIDPNSLMDSKYKVESVEDNASYADTPCLYRIKNSKRAKYAKELIGIVAGFVQAEKFERESVDYYLPYEGLVELINKGLIKRNIKDKNQEAFFEERKQAELSSAGQEQALSDTAGDEPVAEETAEYEQPAEEEIAPQVPDEEPAEEPVAEETAEYEQPAEEEIATQAPVEEPAEEPAVEEAAEYEQPAEEEIAPQAPVEEPAEEPAVEEAAEYEQPAEEETATQAPVEEPAEEFAVEEAAEYEQPAEEEIATQAPVEEPAEEPAVEEAAEYEQPAEEEIAPQAPVEEPAEEFAVEELSAQELDNLQSYEEEADDEDGIEVVGVMFRRRGRKVYWFDPDGQTWEKGEIALYITPDNPPQEVIVVDNAKISPSKLHLPLKPLCKVNRRPQTEQK